MVLVKFKLEHCFQCTNKAGISISHDHFNVNFCLVGEDFANCLGALVALVYALSL